MQITILAFSFLGVCSFSTVEGLKNNPLESQNSRDEVGADQPYYFIMDETQKNRLLANVAHLELGLQRLDVFERLGAPHYERQDVTKKGNTLGKSCIYYLKRWKKDVINEKKDSYVRLEFDNRDRLTKVITKTQDN